MVRSALFLATALPAPSLLAQVPPKIHAKELVDSTPAAHPDTASWLYT